MSTADYEPEEYSGELQGLKVIRPAARSRGGVNAKAKRAGTYIPPENAWQARDLKSVRLFQDDLGEWRVVINRGSPLPATDVEVYLWLRLVAQSAILRSEAQK